MPTDSATNKLLMEVHYYDPYNFTLNEKAPSPSGAKKCHQPQRYRNLGQRSYADGQFQKMKLNFVDRA